jgi:tetratricopeptide (TPR) repeat protein
MGEIARAEEVVRKALDRVKDTTDPYTRVRLYWSIARLAHVEGREAVALTNVRKAIALLQATDDTFHLARAHILAANITLSHDDPGSAETHLEHAEKLLGHDPPNQDLFEIVTQRARIAVLREEAASAVEFGRKALALAGSEADRGLAYTAIGDGLALGAQYAAADESYRQAVDLLEEQGRWRPAANACRAWAKMLRHMGREQEALDVLERATELSMRASPDRAHAEH